MAQGTTKGVPIDIDPLLAADSDLLVPSQKAIKTYVDTENSTKQDTITLTTTGTSGAATLVGSTLNIPDYSSISGTSKSFIGVLQGATVGASLTTYGTFNYSIFNVNENTRIMVIPNACSLSNFYVRIFTAQSGTGSLVFTVRKNAVDTSVVVTIAAGSAANTEANSGATSATFSAGDDCSIKVVNNATATSANVHNTSAMITI